MVHKDLLPLNLDDAVMVSMASVGLSIAAGGGIGGGGILVPIFIIFGKFTPELAIPLSNITIFGGAIGNFYFNRRKSHPLCVGRPVIDYNLMSVFQPMIIIGAIVGTYINKVSPSLVTSVLLVFLLVYTTYKTVGKGLKQYKLENKGEILNPPAQSPTLNLEMITPGGDKDSTSMESSVPVVRRYLTMEDFNNNHPHSEMDESNRTIQKILAREYDFFPKVILGKISVMFSLVLVVTLLRKLAMECGTKIWWFIGFLNLPICLLTALSSRKDLLRDYLDKKEVKYTYLQGDIAWDENTTAKYPSIAILSGLCAGMFGIGGGIINGPLMLALNCLPEVASGTAATMILFTSSTATISFVAFDMLKVDYAILLFILGLVCTIFGQVVLNRIISKSGRRSLIALSMGTITGASAVLMSIQSVGSLLNGDGLKSSGICDSDIHHVNT